MPELSRLFEKRREAFERELKAGGDVKSAYDACVRQLSEIRRDYLSETGDTQQRVRVNQLMAAAQDAISCMLAVTQLDISMKLPNAQPEAACKRRLTMKRFLPYLPAALCAALALWLFLDERFSTMILALAAAGSSYFALYRLRTPARQLPDVTGVTKVDPAELTRRIERLLHDMDALLMSQASDTARPLELTSGLMESMQMLMEARLTEDGAFALKALPQMMEALTQQGVEVRMYDAGNKTDFDLLPAPVGGETIRPALVKDGRVLMRGQATIKG